MEFNSTTLLYPEETLNWNPGPAKFHKIYQVRSDLMQCLPTSNRTLYVGFLVETKCFDKKKIISCPLLVGPPWVYLTPCILLWCPCNSHAFFHLQLLDLLSVAPSAGKILPPGRACKSPQNPWQRISGIMILNMSGKSFCRSQRTPKFYFQRYTYIGFFFFFALLFCSSG